MNCRVCPPRTHRLNYLWELDKRVYAFGVVLVPFSFLQLSPCDALPLFLQEQSYFQSVHDSFEGQHNAFQGGFNVMLNSFADTTCSDSRRISYSGGDDSVINFKKSKSQKETGNKNFQYKQQGREPGKPIDHYYRAKNWTKPPVLSHIPRNAHCT